MRPARSGLQLERAKRIVTLYDPSSQLCAHESSSRQHSLAVSWAYILTFNATVSVLGTDRVPSNGIVGYTGDGVHHGGWRLATEATVKNDVEMQNLRVISIYRASDGRHEVLSTCTCKHQHQHLRPRGRSSSP